MADVCASISLVCYALKYYIWLKQIQKKNAHTHSHTTAIYYNDQKFQCYGYLLPCIVKYLLFIQTWIKWYIHNKTLLCNIVPVHNFYIYNRLVLSIVWTAKLWCAKMYTISKMVKI